MLDFDDVVINYVLKVYNRKEKVRLGHSNRLVRTLRGVGGKEKMQLDMCCIRGFDLHIDVLILVVAELGEK